MSPGEYLVRKKPNSARGPGCGRFDAHPAYRCRFLEERGYTVESATNGEEALPIVKRIHPDIIITDMQMPKMTGTELITASRPNPKPPESRS